MCCVSPSIGAIESCRVRGTNDGCKTEPPYEFRNEMITRNRLLCGTNEHNVSACIYSDRLDEEQNKPGFICGAGSGSVATCIRSQAEEKEVECGSIQICINAINQETNCSIITNQYICVGNPNCFFYGQCLNKFDPNVCAQIDDKDYCGTDQNRLKGSQVCQWIDAESRCSTQVEADISGRYRRTGGFLPACAYAGTCRSVNDVIEVLITVTQKAFSYIGSIAFVFFVYGGFTIILSFGNSEKVNKGKQILVAAIVGLVISFGAYILIDFILDAFRATNSL